MKMETKYYDVTKEINETELAEITSLLNDGEVVAVPTETVYGLAADARNEQAVQKIFKAKGRPSDNPLIVHVATKKQLYTLTTNVPNYVDDLLDAFSPGPITYVLQKANDIAPSVTAGLQTIGIRIPNHPIAQAILSYSNLPLAAPSANLSGRPSPTKAKHVAEDLTGKISAIVDGGSTTVGLESTVLDCTGDVPCILRPGMVTFDDIVSVVGACDIYEKKQTDKPKSPGLKYTHYAPNVPLLLVAKDKIAPTIQTEQDKGKRIALLYHSKEVATIEATVNIDLGTNEATIAKNLYAALRDSEKKNVDMIVCEMPQKQLIKTALFDRLSRAATQIIE